MNYPEALEYIDSFINYEKTRSFDYPEAFKLDRMRTLAKEFGNPQNAYDCAIIAGSKGKGSTAVLLSSILRMENIRVGLYTSPHLLDLRERIRVNGLCVSEARFVELAERLRRTLDSYVWRKNPPTYFEALTALAFLHFKEMKVQVAVLEVGLGGLYDSTNIAHAKVAGITPISLEHTDKLGRTIAKIAVQKCGIIKGREIVVSAPQTEDAENVIQRASEERDAELLRIGREIRVTEREFGDTFQKFDLRTPFGNFFELELGLLGRYQIDNAAQAVAMAKAFEKKTRLRISEAAIRQGLKDAQWPGRLELVVEKGRAKKVLDGAHNADSMEKMLVALRRHFEFGRLVVVLGVSEDKDTAGILDKLLPEADFLIATQASSPRALDAAELGRRAENPKPVFVVKEPADALVKAESLAGSDDLILVTGSLFLVADIKKILEK